MIQERRENKKQQTKHHHKMEQQTIVNSQKIIKNAYINMHIADSESDKVIPELEEYIKGETKFGILQIEIVPTTETLEAQDILFTVDISGSMDDKCKDEKTKMQYATHTMKRIISVFEKSENKKISIEITGFDDKIKKVKEWTRIDENNTNLIKENIEELEARGSTDIELGLKSAIESFQERTKEQEEHAKKTHIFLTDGIATKGESNPKELYNLMLNNTQNINNIYIGFGEDHNANLLQTLGENSKDIYYFVDEIENTGLVFGEIIHSILYKALENIEIIVENGEIYDYLTNSWSNKLRISSLTSEAKKTYHVRTTGNTDAKAIITADNLINPDEIHTLPSLLNDENKIEPNDLTKYMLRQKTQELMYRAKEIINEYTENKYKRVIPFLFEIEDETTTQTQEKQQQKQQQKKQENKEKKTQIKNEINEFMLHLHRHMKMNGLEEDEFHVKLHEDLKVAYKSINSPMGAMYLGSRQYSQGRETSYTPCRSLSGDDTIPMSPLLSRISTTSTQMKIMTELMEPTSSPRSPTRLHPRTYPTSPTRILPLQIPGSPCGKVREFPHLRRSQNQNHLGSGI